MKNIMKLFTTLLLTAVISCLEMQPVFANNNAQFAPDLSLYMDCDIYYAESCFSGCKVVPGRCFSLFMQLGGLNEDGMVEAAMTGYSDTATVRSVQINKTDKYTIFGIYGGMAHSDAYEILNNIQYTLVSSTKNDDGSCSEEYLSGMNLYKLYLETDSSNNVTNVFLTKNV